jgi:hypothetical protein
VGRLRGYGNAINAEAAAAFIEEAFAAIGIAKVDERHSPQTQQFIPPPNTKEGDETPFHNEETAR